MIVSNQLLIFSSSTTNDGGNNTDKIPYCDEADPEYIEHALIVKIMMK
jgi:hypothetical protein